MSRIHKAGKNWMMEFTWEGKRYHKSLGVSDRKTAKLIQLKLDSDIVFGRFNLNNFFSNKRESPSLFELCNKFEKYIEDRKSKYSVKTVESYKYSITLLKNIIGDIDLSNINTNLVENDIESYLYCHYKEGSIRHHMINFRTLLNFALNHKLIKKNPFAGRVPSLKKKKPRYLRENELIVVREYFKREDIPRWQYHLIFLALNTGLRKSELYHLNWGEVDLQNEQLIFSGKGNKERIVPLNQEAISILHQRPRNLSDNRVFYELHHLDSINSAWQRFKVRTKINIRFHDLRSTFASYYIMNGGNIMTLKEILGHEDLQTTMIYATLSKETLHRDKNVVSF